MGVMRSDVQRSLAAILNSDLDSEVGGHPAARILRLFIPFGERAVVEARARQVAQEADLSKSGGVLRIVATRNTLSIALACAKEMRSYVGSEEMHSITGYHPDEVDDFVDSLSRCVANSADD